MRTTRWSVALFIALGALAGATRAQDPPLPPPLEELPPYDLPPPPPPEYGEDGVSPPAPVEPAGKVEVRLTAARAAVADLRIDVDAESEPLAQVLARIGRAAGVPVLAAPDAQESFTVSLREIPWREAVDVLARMSRCQVVDLPGGGALVTRPVTVDLEVVETDVRGVLQLIGRVAGRSVLLSTDVRGLVSVSMKEVPWRDALERVARTAGDLHVVESANCVLVGRVAPTLDSFAGPSLEQLALLGDVRVDVVAERADPVLVCEAIGPLVGRNILVDPMVQGRVDLDLTGAPWGVAVGLIARALGCELEERPGGIIVLWSRPQQRIRAVGAPAAALIRLLASYAGKNVVVGPGMGELVTVDLRGVNYLRALQLLAWVHGWSIAEHPPDVLELTAPQRPEPPLPMTAHEAQVDQLVDDIARLARAGQVDELEVHFAALRGLLARDRSAREVPPPAAPALDGEELWELQKLFMRALDDEPAALAVTLEELGRALTLGGAGAEAALRDLFVERELLLQGVRPEALEGLRLALEVHAGTLVLDTMAAALEREDTKAALRAHATLDAVIERMRGEEAEVFHRNAEAIYLRARELAERAERLAMIAARFGPLLHVQAIVYADQSGKEPDSAIISGAILREGDTLLDPTTDEPIEGLRVLEIEPGRVRFRYHDVEFFRALGADSR